MTVSGVAQMKAKLASIPAAVQKRARDAMEKGADEIVNMMKRLVPVDKGDLRDSIGWTWGDAPAGSVTIGTVRGRSYNTMRLVIYAGNDRAFYARMQEFGIQKQAANPYFFVSYRANKARVKRRITVASRAALKELASSQSVSNGQPVE
ncbi:HK97-gp10 family putative phage morphogenesis protein [Mesorhizobium sp.]|uniref:HK97-gp10 family putative phage morphogenesis protein n=1 Tax=Mesorhizobium sp. TaxID=1871066 RepID=UPI0011F495E1|nr:HK97-gp10 family putative phage morphogenesis protein [Mesorhizobium sp.]TIN10387.1 MAG: HK97 gp10 family phage protein [Mesorhizobium sp.]